MDSTSRGAEAYGDASGANGALGTARSYDAFKNSGAYGGFNFAKDQGTQAINRAHSAGGSLVSGGLDADTAKYVEGLAGQTWGNYTSGLQPYLNANAAAVGGAAGVATGQGGALDASYRGQGNAANANYTGQGASTAAATMNNYNIGQNQLSALTAAAQLAMGMPPTSLGGGGAPGSQVGGTSGPATYGGPNGPTQLFGAFA